MKNFTIMCAVLLCTVLAHAQVGIGTTSPDPNSILDIYSNDKGLLIPRVALTSRDNLSPITGPATTGLMVFNTNTVGSTEPNAVFPGFYYWDADSLLWMRVATGGTVTKDWRVSGNGDIDDTTDFLGTTNNQDLVIVTNGIERMRIDSLGNISIGTTNITSKLKIDRGTETIPALEIVPKTTTPAGTATGQIAVIDNLLYMYDQGRGKWLSVETTTLKWGSIKGDKGKYLEYFDIVNGNSGPRMPFNGTIVYIAAQSSNSQNKQLSIRKNNANTVINNFSLISGVYSATNANLDFNEGDYLKIFIANGGNDVENLTVTLWVKWRK